MMTPEESYVLFNALKLHFTSTTYDFHKFNGKISHTLKETNKFYLQFKKLGEYGKDDVVGLILSNIILNPKLFIIDLFSKQAKEEYDFWKLRIENKYHILYKELQLLKGKYPAVKKNYIFLIDYYYSKEITLESLVLLNNYITFNNIAENIIVEPVLFKIKKYTPFLSCDNTTVERILRNLGLNYQKLPDQ